MLIREIVESPLPDDWDKKVFTGNPKYSQMIKYAKERAAQVGRGSSRVAFLIDYQGRKTVLKIALNGKGIAQNTEEANLLSYHDIQNSGIVIPMIDHDEANGDRVTWIHTEYAQKITQKQLEKFFNGVPMMNIATHLNKQRGKTKYHTELPEELFDNPLYLELEELVVNYDLPPFDLARKANWGVYDGKPVIIDLGFTESVYQLHYR